MSAQPTNKSTCPCVECDLPKCEAGPKITREFSQIVDLSDAEDPEHQWYWPNYLIEASLSGLAEIYLKNGTPSPSPEIALPAIFDLAVNAFFASGLTDSGWVYCLGPSGKLPPVQYYSFVGMCPRCGINGHYFPARAHKPTSARIGDASSTAIMLILNKILHLNSSGYQLTPSTNRQGDVDIFIFGEDVLAMGEIKASPLISYPLEIALSKTLTTDETDDGVAEPRPNHELNSPRIVSEAPSISLYVPQRDIKIELGPKSGVNWPYAALAGFVSDPDNLQTIIDAWNMAYQAYRQKDRSKPVFYLTHGCGTAKGVTISDSKNAPGIDRTDDIKKGTYQLLKYGAYIAEKCERRLVRSILTGNMHAIIHEEQYVSELEDVVWTKDRLKFSENDETVTWRRQDLFNLFDGLVCLSKVVTLDPVLKKLFDLETFSRNLTAGRERR